MEVIPAIDLRNGAAVQLVGGDVRHEKVRVDDPAEQAREFVRKGARWIHIVDLDRALGLGNNLQVIKSILEAVPQARVQVGGGVRFTEDIDDLFMAGAARVVVGTRAVMDEKWFAHCCGRYGERLFAAVDARGEDILVKGWQESSGRNLMEWARKADAQGVGGFLYTDVAKEGRMAGVNEEDVKRLASAVRRPVIASGGVRGMDDLRALERAGAWGVVVGMAAYTGSLDLAEAFKTFRGS